MSPQDLRIVTDHIRESTGTTRPLIVKGIPPFEVGLDDASWAVSYEIIGQWSEPDPAPVNDNRDQAGGRLR